MQPQTATNDLVEQLQRFRNSGRYSQIDLRRLERDAEAVKKHHPVEGLMLLGMVACLREDVPGARENHEASIRAYGENPILLRNYATSMASLGFRSDAAELERRAYISADGDMSLVRAYASSLFVIGRINALHELMLDSNISYLESEQLTIETVHSIAEAAQACCVTDDDFESATSLVNSVMQECGYYLNSAYPMLINSGSEAWFSYVVWPVRANSADEIDTLNGALLDYLVERSLPAFEASLVVARFSLMHAGESAA